MFNNLSNQYSSNDYNNLRVLENSNDLIEHGRIQWKEVDWKMIKIT